MKGVLHMENRINDIINTVKVNELFHKKEEEEKQKNCILKILAVVGIVTVIAGIAYAVFRYLTPDEEEVFEDEFEDETDEPAEEEIADAVEDIFEDEGEN